MIEHERDVAEAHVERLGARYSHGSHRSPDTSVQSLLPPMHVRPSPQGSPLPPQSRRKGVSAPGC